MNGLERSWIFLKGLNDPGRSQKVLKGCQSSSKAFKVQRGPYWFRKVLQVLERSWIALRRTSNEIKHVEWKKKDLTSYKVCKVMTQFPFLFLLTKQHFRPGTGPKKISDQFFPPKNYLVNSFNNILLWPKMFWLNCFFDQYLFEMCPKYLMCLQFSKCPKRPKWLKCPKCPKCTKS